MTPLSWTKLRGRHRRESGANAQKDLLRLDDFLFDAGLAAADDTIELILSALQILQAHPRIGRPVGKGLHELIISRGTSGHIALYEYVEAKDEIRVLAIRHQRELDYRGE